MALWLIFFEYLHVCVYMHVCACAYISVCVCKFICVCQKLLIDSVFLCNWISVRQWPDGAKLPFCFDIYLNIVKFRVKDLQIISSIASSANDCWNEYLGRSGERDRNDTFHIVCLCAGDAFASLKQVGDRAGQLLSLILGKCYNLGSGVPS